MTKSKVLLIDFRKQPPTLIPITIDSEVDERVDKYKYHGFILCNNMTYNRNVFNVYKNAITHHAAYYR